MIWLRSLIHVATWSNRTTVILYRGRDQKGKNPLRNLASLMFTLWCCCTVCCGFRERDPSLAVYIGAQVIATREMDKVYMQVLERKREGSLL